jgi:hypothetical protein
MLMSIQLSRSASASEADASSYSECSEYPLSRIASSIKSCCVPLGVGVETSGEGDICDDLVGVEAKPAESS